MTYINSKEIIILLLGAILSIIMTLVFSKEKNKF
jgi:hypothetical protein